MAQTKIKSVEISGLAALKLTKHCQESLPSMVTGSLLGLTVGDVLEVTCAFPFPSQGKNDSDEDMSAQYQLEMMKMLREVNVDNNCVGWYQSMLLGSYSTASLVENQLMYQTDLSPNAVLILFDPLQSHYNGQLVIRAYRLTEEAVKCLNSSKSANFISPSAIFEEIPVSITNNGLARALLYDLAATQESTSQQLNLDYAPFLEKNLEHLSSWVDDLANEQHKFQYYTRQLQRNSDNVKNPPKRLESLLISHQIRQYCDQMDRFTGECLGRMQMADSLRSRK